MSAPSLNLIETMRFDDGIALLDRHMARLRRSAGALDIPFDEQKVQSRLEAACNALDKRAPKRIRLVVDANGAPDVSVAPLTTVDGVLSVAISATRVDARNRYMYHKTTNRAVYDREWTAAQEAGLFEVLYLNEEDMVAEGSRTNIFVRSGGRLLTPHVECGLLPGVYRSVILDSFPEARELPLAESQLREAEAVYLCNAVIGLRKVHLIDSPTKF